MATIWVVDTSSICEIRRGTEKIKRPALFEGLTALVASGRLIYPRTVVDELERNVEDSKNPDQQFEWADRNFHSVADLASCTLLEVRDVLAVVPKVLDPDKDSGVEEADPYVLAVAVRLRAEGKDARIVAQETKDTPKKMSMSTAAGVLGIPCVPLMAFLQVEKWLDSTALSWASGCFVLVLS